MKFWETRKLVIASGTSPKYEIGNSGYTIDRNYPLDKWWAVGYRICMIRDKDERWIGTVNYLD